MDDSRGLTGMLMSSKRLLRTSKQAPGSRLACWAGRDGRMALQEVNDYSCLDGVLARSSKRVIVARLD